MILYEYLLEELDEPVPFIKRERHYYFKIDDNKYKVSFFKPGDTETSLKLAVELKFTPEELNDITEFGFSMFQGKKQTIELTGTGHVKKVFSTVLAIAKQHIKKNKPKYLMFKGVIGEKSRIRFYTMLYNNFFKYTDEYEPFKIIEVSNNKCFILKRKDK